MDEIVRGTTPTLEFTFDIVDPADITTAYLVVLQGGNAVFEKDLDSATREDRSILWTLSQEETLMLASGRQVRAMCDWKLSNGTRGRSNIWVADVTEPGKKEKI